MAKKAAIRSPKHPLDARRPMVTARCLREVLKYDPDTGEFTWRMPRRRVAPGRIAGSTNRRGYVCIKLDGRDYLAHRLAWLYMTGAWPVNEIDHKSGKANNWGIIYFTPLTLARESSTLQG